MRIGVVPAVIITAMLGGCGSGGNDRTPTGSVADFQLVAPDLSGAVRMEMVWIEPGTFLMGSPESEPGRNADEGPRHEVTISRGFWLGRYEITQAQWESVMGMRPWSGQSYVQENPNHPAVYISWNDAREFIRRLNEAAGEDLYRLPTEAEWEYACRARTETPWSFGDDEDQLGNYAWYSVNAWDVSEQYAHAVGVKLPNPWDLYDMHGNVLEWVQDYWVDGEYAKDNQLDPTGPSTGSDRIYRGGSFRNSALRMRTSTRYHNLPSFRHGFVGMRLLREGP